MFIIEYLLPFIVVFGILVFVHEAGHYLAAKQCGVDVSTFSIGFGPELIGFNDRSGTRWKISAIPLGGYVKMLGDMDAASRPDSAAAMLPDDLKARAFPHKSVGQRAWIIAGGPLANFVFAAFLLMVLLILEGHPFPRAEVGSIAPGYPAEESGLQVGDTVVAIDGREVSRFMEIPGLVNAAAQDLPAVLEPGAFLDYETYRAVVRSQYVDTVTVTADRDGQVFEVFITPIGDTTIGINGEEQPIYRLGIGAPFESFGLFEAAYAGIVETVALSYETLVSVGQIFAGERGTDELGGPIRIAQISGDVAQLGLTPLLWFMVLLSINLALINLFPIPILDGGHLLLLSIEAVLGRPLSERVQEYGFRIGFALVLTLMVFATWNDLVNLDVFDFISGLVS